MPLSGYKLLPVQGRTKAAAAFACKEQINDGRLRRDICLGLATLVETNTTLEGFVYGGPRDVSIKNHMVKMKSQQIWDKAEEENMIPRAGVITFIGVWLLKRLIWMAIQALVEHWIGNGFSW
jgi:hypothetical protein